MLFSKKREKLSIKLQCAKIIKSTIGGARNFDWRRAKWKNFVTFFGDVSP